MLWVCIFQTRMHRLRFPDLFSKVATYRDSRHLARAGERTPFLVLLKIIWLHFLLEFPLLPHYTLVLPLTHAHVCMWVRGLACASHSYMCTHEPFPNAKPTGMHVHTHMYLCTVHSLRSRFVTVNE